MKYRVRDVGKAVSVAIAIIIIVIAGIGFYYLTVPGKPGTGSSTTPAQRGGNTTTPTGTLTIIDDLNRSVSIRTPVHRVVSTIRIVSSFLLQFDMKNRLVGADSTTAKNPFYTAIDPWLRNVTVVATGKRNVNLEEIIGLQPDVVFAKTYQRPLLQGIEDKVPIVYLDLETPEVFMHDIRLVGKILGEEERAQFLTNYYNNIIGLIKNKTAALPEDQRPKVLFIYYRGENSYNVPPTHWIQSYMVRLAGGRIIEFPGTGWKEISIEQMISYNPDIVFVTAYHGVKPREAAVSLMNNTLLSTVNAVRNHRVYPIPFDGEPWDIPTPKWVLCTLYMAVKIHPELFGNINMTRETINFYVQVYGASQGVAASLVPGEVKD